MRSFPSDFAFIGDRDYVHGPTFFEAFREGVLQLAGAQAGEALRVRYLRVNRTVRANGTIVVAGEDEPLPGAERPAAEMSCRAGGRSWHAAFHEGGQSPITRRTAPRERDFVRDVELSSAFSGVARLQKLRGDDDLFQAVVEANKQVHLHTLTGNPLSPTPRFRFVYCLDYQCAPSMGDGTASVRIHSQGLRDLGEYEFSLTALELRLGAFSSSFRLCFASSGMKGGELSGQS
jgi:hypothetical protein